MRWTDRPPFVPPAGVDRARLRRVALRYATHGWPVIPGAYLAGTRYVCGRAGCLTTGCHPALDGWDRAGAADPARVAGWWRHRPHTVLLATGTAFDVLDVPAQLGARALGAARLGALAVGPVAVTPVGRWMFLVRAGDPLRPELEDCLDVVRHGRGSWIPAPPNRAPEGRVRWAVTPEQVRWRLPEPYAVQELLVDAFGPAHRLRHAA
ncbi:bifunctional DNA primase/polymerase [Spirilliplanes yamanashiensis]|uniref:DNA primase n=1 Tax=Spirilliplanes yamanashiensis TaxID=42233 RepID=A0A8J3YEF3_9ACTN|nr:bifunctional DNA primase/polymerase [Spirilliplanes yamanashiensis]MDP9816674.1 hypothetical protein [Spirilliplanes yamanashiensis]GIJ06197.1 DNA primase [Spirilliplanes yamanashiensis]